MSIYIPTNNTGEVTFADLARYATINSLNNGLASKIEASGTPVFSAGTITSTSTMDSEGVLSADAGLNVTGTLAVTGNETVSGTLGVTGLITASNGVSIPGGKTLSLANGVSTPLVITNSGGNAYSVTCAGGLVINPGGGGYVQVNSLFASGATTVSGALGVTSTLTSTGLVTCNGGLSCPGAITAGSLALTTGLGYLEAYNDAVTPQTLTNLDNNIITFNTIATNTFSGSVLTVSGTNNTTFTNASAAAITVAVTFSASCIGDIVSVLRSFITMSTNGRYYAMVMSLGGSTSLQNSSSTTLYLPAGASFQCVIYPNSTGTITSGTNTTNRINMITIKQLY